MALTLAPLVPRLREYAARAAAHASLERSTGAFVHQVLHPQPSPIAVLLRWMRLLSSWLRRWPSR